MKIQNVSSATTPVPVSVMRGDGGTTSISLNQGEFIYTDSPIESKSIIVLNKKGLIKTSHEEKPNNFEYFIVYAKDTQGSESPVTKTVTNIPSDKDSALEKYKNEFKIPVVIKAPTKPEIVIDPALDIHSNKVLFPEKVKQANEVLKDVKLPEVPKNKGGRPKGSKDTVKRGETKLKKPAGRPINTAALVGMGFEDVKSKCEARGYSIRITQKDGASYMITCDLRFDRVNVVIENGIVTKADIG